MAARATRSRRNAKFDIMTGFTGSKPPDLDLGLKGEGYFEKWTTLSLPDTGKNSSVDDDSQPSGGGAPATSIPGPPLKVPMEADDVGRPKIREGREARRSQARILRKVASEIRRLDPVTARRLMAAADELTYDALSTASLPEAGDETNEVDDYQDNLGHGTLQFYGTDPAKSTSLTRESARRVAEKSFAACEISYKYPDGNWKKEICETKAEYNQLMKDLKKEGAQIKVKHLDRDDGDVETNLQYASRGSSRIGALPSEYQKQMMAKPSLQKWVQNLSVRYPNVPRDQIVQLMRENRNDVRLVENALQEMGQSQGQKPGNAPPSQGQQPRGASRRRKATGGKGINDVKWSSLDLVGRAIDGEYDRGAVLKLLDADYKRTRDLLHGGSEVASPGGGATSAQPAQTQAAVTGRRARTQGDKSLKPQPTVGDQDGIGADGAGGFYKDSKAPLQETMAADDVERPKIRENPEAARLGSLWHAFRSEIIRQAAKDGKWNSGRYAIEARDYGDSVEIQASIVDRENLPMPVGSMLFSKLHDSPRGRYATVEVNDGILENRTMEFTLRKPRQASRVVKRVVAGITQMSKDVLDGITV